MTATVKRTRAQLWLDRVLALIAGGLILAAVVFGALAATGKIDNRSTTDCAPVDYAHGAWTNAAGQQVAVSQAEDDVLHYVGACR